MEAATSKKADPTGSTNDPQAHTGERTDLTPTDLGTAYALAALRGNRGREIRTAR